MVNHNKTRQTIKKNYLNYLQIIGINCNGLSGKRDSLVANISVIKAISFSSPGNKIHEKGVIQIE